MGLAHAHGIYRVCLTLLIGCRCGKFQVEVRLCAKVIDAGLESLEDLLQKIENCVPDTRDSVI